MGSRSNVIKSKSSNSAITTRSGLRESTRSNLQFQRNVIKKRGVYVENKATKRVMGSPVQNTKQERPATLSPLPRPESKGFLASVLTILSKNTAATQYPDNIDHNATHSKQRKMPRRETRQETTRNTYSNDPQKRKKFKSKVLKKGVTKDEKEQKVVVLQPQKEMENTSSIFSVSEIRQSLVKKAQQYKEEKKKAEDLYSDVNNSLVREILEGKQRKENKEKRVRIDDPTTVVGLANVKTGDDNNKGLYNFFVDLLETINIHDVVNKSTDLVSEASTPKIALEMDEDVAKKLEVKCHSPACRASRSPSPESNFYCLKEGEEFSGPVYKAPSIRKQIRVKRPLKAQSFSAPAKPQPKKLKSESYTPGTNKVSRKKKKENLLNMFKEQLRIDESAFEEPQNLYEALKIIADNKRKCQTTIHFEEKMKRNRKDSGFPECMFRRPWVLGGKKKKAKKNEPIAKKRSEVRSYGKVRTNGYTTDVSNGSQYSLKVFGYDYEAERPPQQAFQKALQQEQHFQRPVKEVVMTYHSSPSSSDRGLGSVDDDFEYTDSYFNTFSRAPTDF